MKYKANNIRQLRETTVKYFDPPLSKNKYFDDSFQMQAIINWNNLLKEIIEASSLAIFKSKLFMYIARIENQNL